MANPVDLKSNWGIVEVVVKSRRRELQRYQYFEELWNSLHNDNQLIFLQAPTGAGKTEAVLVPFIRSLVDSERVWHSLLYVLPTRSLVFNMFHRIHKTLNICKHAFKKPERVIIDYDYGGFTPFKAFIEGDLTITTYDTLLYTSYGFRSYGHHYLLSLGKIAGSLVILDEVQLLQDERWYSLSLLPYHIANLVIFGATVIVMTATLPHLLVEDIGKALKPFERLQGVEYKWTSIKMEPNKDIVRRGKVEVNIEKGKLLNRILNIAKNNEKPMLLIFNTVERAVEAYRQLTKNGYNNVILLHSRMVSGERKERESYFEKKVSINDDLIVVATQVVEAGLDYDFKTVATEISPIDSLIQRLGRCGRKCDGIAFVFDDLNQTEGVYPNVVMSETSRILDKHLLEESVRNVSISSSLVDKVYSEDVVEKLKSEASKELRNALDFIKTFSTDKIFRQRTLLDEQAQNIFRLGIEIKCILLPQETYQKVLREMLLVKEEKTPIRIPFNFDQAINLLNQNILSLSIKRLFKDIEIPSLKHRINDKEMYLLFSIVHKHDTHCEVEIVKYDNLFRAIKGRGGLANPFIINPAYYLFEGNYHLGLVKPYGETTRM
jgi:CRISPR-associated endonuclease/helicase Cas3